VTDLPGWYGAELVVGNVPGDPAHRGRPHLESWEARVVRRRTA
jgi:hypothetical protein